MQQIQDMWEKAITPGLSYKFGSINFSPSYVQAAAIVFLLFLLILTIARIRHLYIHWSLGKSSMSMIFWGFILAVIVEGFLLIGGRTLFTEILGWKNVPKPISNFLDIGRNKVISVLGITDEISTSNAKEKPKVNDLIDQYKALPENDALEFRKNICLPQ